MISFLKTVLIILLVYLGLKIILRLAKPFLLRFLAKKMNQRFESAFGQNPFQPNQNNAGERTHDTKTSSKNPKSKKVVGEYIDFEEVE